MSGSSDPRAPDVRPAFQKVAKFLAIGILILGAVFGFVPDLPLEVRVGAVGSCLVVGFIMFQIGTTGQWPPRSKK